MLGSSPLARGTRPRATHRTPRPGLIPARAGNTPAPNTVRGLGWAHPRSRGEHSIRDGGIVGSSGSSPLARGTRLWHGVKRLASGLIPARAGNTESGCTAKITGGAHPRSRGEHDDRPQTQCWRRGSSPLARGTHDYGKGFHFVEGLIPARAGNTYFYLFPFTLFRAHPRSRGEHTVEIVEIELIEGSSPLARGTREHLFGHVLTQGLIPARAGNTLYLRVIVFSFRAHPRSRGEHHDVFSFCWLAAGSSPLARGTLLPADA